HLQHLVLGLAILRRNDAGSSCRYKAANGRAHVVRTRVVREGEALFVEGVLERRAVDARFASDDEALFVDLDDLVHAANVDSDATVGCQGATLGAGAAAARNYGQT